MPLPLSGSAGDQPCPALASLLSRSDCWPAWLKDGDSWCLAVLPVWVLVRRGVSTVLHHRQPDGNYHTEDVVMDDAALPGWLRQQLAGQASLGSFMQGFSGGLLGWLGYDYQRPSPSGRLEFPDACFACHDLIIRPDDAGLPHLYAASATLAQWVLAALNQPPDMPAFNLETRFQAQMTRADYQRAFTRVQDYLHSGDCYQVNLAQAFQARCAGSSLPAFHTLLALSQPPYAAYLSCPYGDILSLSPELFLSFAENGTVLTRPIKGTRPRRADAAGDQAEHDDLATHPKDRAENLMIVDLLRHDLGRHAETGSVHVPELFRIESFPQVHHLVSTITCRLKTNSHPLDLLFDAFPGGSITGAPKKRAMEIIGELENRPRAIYCGTIGYLTPEGRGQWNIAIRTLLRCGDRLHAWAGGGIVADSNCEAEYQECFNKMGALLGALEREFLSPAPGTGDSR